MLPLAFPPPRRLLVRGVNWLGDAVMTTPALLRLREAWPQTHFTLLTHEKLVGLWAGHPALDEVITFGPRDGVFSLARRLRPAEFDAALLLPNSLRSALEVALARIPKRVGYAGGGRNWLLTHAIPWRRDVIKMQKRTVNEVRRLAQQEAATQPVTNSRAGGHHVFHYLHLSAALGASGEPLAPLIAVSEAELSAARSKFQLPAGPIVGLNAGAEYGPAKRWPTERFIATAKALRERRNCSFAIFGGPADNALASEIDAALSGPTSAVINLAGHTSLRELCAALRACNVLLTNDTGPMHLAAAVGTRVVALFGSTAPELTCPGLPSDARHVTLRGLAPCSPCFLRECPVDFRCMHSLDVNQVADAVARQLGQK